MAAMVARSESDQVYQWSKGSAEGSWAEAHLDDTHNQISTVGISWRASRERSTSTFSQQDSISCFSVGEKMCPDFPGHAAAIHTLRRACRAV